MRWNGDAREVMRASGLLHRDVRMPAERERISILLERRPQARSFLRILADLVTCLFPFSDSVDRRQRIDRGCAGEYILS